MSSGQGSKKSRRQKSRGQKSSSQKSRSKKSRGQQSQGEDSRVQQSQGQQSYDDDIQGQQAPEDDSQSYVVDENTNTQGGDEDYTQDGTATNTLPDCLHLMQYCSEAFAPHDDSPITAQKAADSWNPVRDWLGSHDMDGIREAAEMRDNDGKTAIHFACQNMPPIDIVDIFLAVVPEVVQWPDVNGWLPIHYACAYDAKPDVIKTFAEFFPESKVTMDRKGRTPLHFFLGSQGTRNLNNHEVVLSLSSTGAATYPTEEGLLPLHLACAYGRSEETLYVLIDAYPEAVSSLDNKQRTPLHFVLSNANRKNSPAAVRVLLATDRNLVNSIGGGPLPLLVLAQFAKTGVDRRNAKEEDAVKGCLNQLLLAEPKPTPRLFSALQRLPDFLRDQALVAKSVQEMFNRKIAERFVTMVLMMDLYFQLVILVAYFFGVQESQWLRKQAASQSPGCNPDKCDGDAKKIGFLYDSDLHRLDPAQRWSIVICVYLLSLYFIFRELVQSISRAFLGDFSNYIRNPSTLINVVYIIAILVWATMILLGVGDFRFFVSGTSLSVIVIIVKFLTYLRKVRIDFAIFIGGVTHVLIRLRAFTFCVVILLFAFTQFFTTLYKRTSYCESAPPYYYAYSGDSTQNHELAHEIMCDEYDPYPWCNFWRAFLRMTIMFLGEVDDGYFMYDSQVSTPAQIMFILFMFFMVILLANVLIAIVTDSYKVIQDQRAEIVFWSNRLDFIAEMDAIVNGPWLRKISLMMGFGSKKKESRQNRRNGADTWNRIMDLLFEEDLEGGYFLSALFRLLCILVIPLWFLLGAFTFGILWPPQIRAFFFTSYLTKADKAEEEDNLRKNEIASLHVQIEAIRNEVSQELAKDRTQMVQLRSSVAERRMELQYELNHIKRAMTMLFEQQANNVYTT